MSILSSRKLALESESPLKLSIISSSSEILARHSAKVRRAALDILRRRNIKIELGHRVTRFQVNGVQTDLGGEYVSDATFYATGASLPDWPACAGIAMSDDGFIDTLPTLQSASHDFVFAAGDAATIRGASGGRAADGSADVLQHHARGACRAPPGSMVI